MNIKAREALGSALTLLILFKGAFVGLVEWLLGGFCQMIVGIAAFSVSNLIWGILKMIFFWWPLFWYLLIATVVAALFGLIEEEDLK